MSGGRSAATPVSVTSGSAAEGTRAKRVPARPAPPGLIGPAGAGERGARAAVAHTLVLAGRNLVQYARVPAILINTVIFPACLLLVFDTVYGRTVEEVTGSPSGTRLVALTTMVAAMFGGTSSGLALLQDREAGLLARLHTMPVHRAAPIAGRLLAEAARVVVAAVVLALVGHLIGFRFSAGPLAAVAYFAVVAGVSAGLAAPVLVLALRARGPAGVGMLAPLYILMMFFNTGFVPADHYPDAISGLVRVLPVSAVVDSLLGLSEGGALRSPLLLTLAWFGGLAAVFGTVAVRSYRRAVSGDGGPSRSRSGKNGPEKSGPEKQI